MISQTAEYALRACLHLAQHQDKRLPLQHIARATEVPAGYLSKVLQTLRRGGVVDSLRGKQGGFVLRKHPAEVSLFDIVNAVNPMVHLTKCPLTADDNCPRHGFDFTAEGVNLCPLHNAISGLTQQIEQQFRGLTLQGFLQGYDGTRPGKLTLG